MMEELIVGERRYRLHVEERVGGWVAHAERPETGARISADWRGGSRDEVV